NLLAYPSRIVEPNGNVKGIFWYGDPGNAAAKGLNIVVDQLAVQLKPNELMSSSTIVLSEQASAITASNFTTMCFMVVRLSPSIHLLDVRQLPKSRLVILYWARRTREVFCLMVI